jgi:hypothetical protein
MNLWSIWALGFASFHLLILRRPVSVGWPKICHIVIVCALAGTANNAAVAKPIPIAVLRVKVIMVMFPLVEL